LKQSEKIMNQSTNAENFDGNNLASDIWAMLGAPEKTSANTSVAPQKIVSSEEILMNDAPDLATEILSRLEQKKETAAAHLGISAAEFETMPFDLTALEQAGIFLKIDATGFSVLSRQLDWQSLGIELPKEQTVHLSPPRTGLLPDDYRKPLQRAASRTHNALDRYSSFVSRCAKPCLVRASIAGFLTPPLKRLKKNSPPRSKTSPAPKPQSSKITLRFSKPYAKLSGSSQPIPPNDWRRP